MHACLVTQSCLTLRPYGPQPARLLCPWGSLGKNTGVGCHALLQGIFPMSPVSPTLSGRSFTTEPLGKLCFHLKPILKMSAELYSFKSSRKSISLSFPAFGGHLHSSVHRSLLCLESRQHQAKSSSRCPLWFSLSSLSLPYLRTLMINYTGLRQIRQNHLPSQGQLINNLHSPLPYNLTYSQADLGSGHL